MIKILLVDDHELFIEGLSILISKEDDMKVIGVTSDSNKVFHLINELNPDIVIMDISMPDLNGFEATERIISENPSIKIIGLSSYSKKRYVVEMLKKGARGYVLKSSASKELKYAIRSVMDNNFYLSPKVSNILIEDYIINSDIPADLTPKEREILKMFAEGMSVREISINLELSTKTIETYKKQLMDKVQVSNFADLIKYAVREGIVPL